MISIKSLTVAYGKRIILEDVNAEFERGTITVIKGESGSGKSSLLNVLGLMQAAPHFEYIFDGKNVSKFNDKERADFRLHNIGFVFQQSHLVQELTAIDNLVLPMTVTPQSNLYAKADELIRFVGLEDVKNDYPSSLSGGEEQRLALARAIANDADIILADEPTAALDAKNSKIVLDLFSKLAHELNKIVIVVSHNELVCQYADVICEIKKKKLVVTKTGPISTQPVAVSAEKKDIHKRKALRFISFYSKKKSTSRALNGVFMAVTALVAAVAILSANFGANIMGQQDDLINAISDKSLFIVNNTWGHRAQVSYEDDPSIPPEVIAQIASIPGVNSVYPWYNLRSSGYDPDNTTDPTILRITEGDVVLAEKAYPNTGTGVSVVTPDGSFVVCPLYDEEDYSYLLEYKSDSDITSGLILTMQVALQLSANPAELIGKRIEVSCLVPVKLYETVIRTWEHDANGNPIGDGIPWEVESPFYKYTTFESTVTGILPRSYNMQRVNNTSFIYMNYGQLINIIEQNKDMNIGERFPGFPEKELGPNSLVVFVDDYSDVARVTSEIEEVSEFFDVVNNAADVGTIKSNLMGTKNMLTIVTVVFIGVVAVTFSMLYYLKNRSRKKEIGILKAIGFTRSNIAGLTSLEMLKMALPAFVLSIGLAFLLAHFGNGLSYFADIHGRTYFSVSASSLLVGFLVCFVVVVLSGLFPIYSASKIDPIEAIRKINK